MVEKFSITVTDKKTVTTQLETVRRTPGVCWANLKSCDGVYTIIGQAV